MRLIDLERSTGLTRPTVHRILGALSRRGLVEQQFETRRYRISQETGFIRSEFGLWAQRLRHLCKQPLCDAATDIGDTVILLARSGKSTVCVARFSGKHREQPLMVEIGTSRPLGVGAGGIAILSALEDTQATAIVRSLRPQLKFFPNASPHAITIAVRTARANGYAFSDGFVRSNVRGLAVPILNERKTPIGALCTAATYDRINSKSLPHIADTLMHYQETIERLIARHADEIELFPQPDTANENDSR